MRPKTRREEVSLEKREVEFYRTFVSALERLHGVRMVRPYPTTRVELQIDFPEYGSIILDAIAERIPLSVAWEECKPFRPLLGWVQRNGWTPPLVRAAIQLTEMYKKVFEVCPDDYVVKALDTFHGDEESLWTVSEEDSELLAIAAGLIQKWIGPRPRPIRVTDLRQGPGATATGANHVDRYRSLPRFEVQELVDDMDSFLGVLGVDFEVEENAARMIAVPKTATKPRLISAEPHWNLMFQQALFDQMSERMARYPFLNIFSQDRNGRLCKSLNIATIDQSRASDRVSLAHVVELFPPDWVEYLLAGRTDAVHCLCGETHTLRKFAGMGSSTTFPVETLVFAAVACAAIIAVEPGTHEALDYERLGFYGDDAIVPEEHATTVLEAYARLGFIPNTSKSYWEGPFRESCGVYSYQGIDVTPARRSRWLPDKGRDVAEIIAAVEFINRAEYLYTGMEELHSFVVGANVPTVPYIIDQSGAKSALISADGGFGFFSWDLLGTKCPRSRPLKVRPVRRQTPSEYDGMTVLAIALHQLEQRTQVGCLPRQLAEWFYPRPIGLRLRK